VPDYQIGGVLHFGSELKLGVWAGRQEDAVIIFSTHNISGGSMDRSIVISAGYSTLISVAEKVGNGVCTMRVVTVGALSVGLSAPSSPIRCC
jgi:hypothetical protein